MSTGAVFQGVFQMFSRTLHCEGLEETLGKEGTLAEVDEALDAITAGAVADSVESRTLDFKRQGRSREDILKDLAIAAACFANSLGGSLIVGVKDRASGEDAFEGTDLDADRVVRRIYELTEPHLTVDILELNLLGRRLLHLRVPRSPEVHQVDGRATHRVQTSCEPMTASQIATLLSERRGEDWSNEDSGRSTGEVSRVALEMARLLLRQSADPQRRAYSTESDDDLLRVLGLVSEHGTLLQAGSLLIGEPRDNTNDLVVYQYRRTPAGEPVVMQRLPGPLLPALLRVLELVDARVDKTPVNLPDGQQIQLADLPEAVVREAIANAVIHRDYRRGGAVRVEHAPTRLVVTSPGPLVQGVTVQNILTTTSRPRNGRLAAAVRMLGLAEEAGVGVDRMYREMVRVGHEPPQFVEDPDQLQVALLGGAPNKNLTRFVATLPAAEGDDADTMLVLYTLLTRRTISASQLSDTLQKGTQEVESVLRRLAGDPVQLIEPTRETARRKHPNYRLREHAVSYLGAAITYRRRTTDEYDRKIIELVRETRQINARMVKIALDLGTAAASRVMGDLVAREVLVKTSEAQRGPGVTYGPGPAFPSARPRRGKHTSTARPEDPSEPKDDTGQTPLF